MKKLPWISAAALIAGLHYNGHSQILMEDETFSTDGILQWGIGDPTDHYNHGTQVLTQADGKILFGGANESADGVFFTLGRLNTDGSPDNTFDGDGFVMHQAVNTDDSYLFDIALQADGKILACGFTMDDMGNAQMVVTRYTTAGALDDDFGTGGVFVHDMGPVFEFATTVEVLADGKIVVSGMIIDMMDDANLFVVRLNDNGTLDNTFTGGGVSVIDQDVTSEYITHMVVQTDGKMVVAGYSEEDGVDGTNVLLVRLDEDGNLDNTFGTAGFVATPVGDAEAEVRDLEQQADGKLVLAVQALFDNGMVMQYDFATLRYTVDGALDNTFGTGGMVFTEFDGSAGDEFSNTVLIDESGNILVGGSLINEEGMEMLAMVRYDENGTVDTGFDGDGFFTEEYDAVNQTMFAMTQQEDGKIVMLGGIENPDAGSDFFLVRYKLVDDAGTNTPGEFTNLEVYPNPTTGTATIAVNDASDLQKLEVMNMAGQVVYEQVLSDNNAQQLHIDLADQEDGIYLLRITRNDAYETVRILKTSGN